MEPVAAEAVSNHVHSVDAKERGKILTNSSLAVIELTERQGAVPLEVNYWHICGMFERNCVGNALIHCI